MPNLHLRRLSATAVFLAISLVLRMTVSGYLPLFGANGVRVGIHGVFTIMPAILFGPWYGAVVSGLEDVLGHIIRPTGAYLPPMTIVMIAGGFLRGWVWRLLRNRNTVNTRCVVAAVAALLLFAGGYNFLRLRIDGVDRNFFEGAHLTADISEMGFISRLLIERSQDSADIPPTVMLARRRVESTYAPVVAGAFGFVLLGVDIVLSRRAEKKKHFSNIEHTQNASSWNGSIMPLALTIIIVSLLINFANTIVLRQMAFPAWQLLPLLVVWMPRALGAFLVSIMNVYIAAFLLGICNKEPHIRALID